MTVISSNDLPAARLRAAPAARGGLLDRFWPGVSLAPSILLFLVLTLLPIANLVVMSFHDITWQQGRATWTPVGLRHYAALADDPLFKAGIGNTAIFATVAVAVQMLLGFFLAVLTSRVFHGRVIYRTIFVLPILVPGIVIGAMWKLMYNFDFGIINQAIGLVGMMPRDFLGDRNLALASVIVVDIWHWTPFCFLLLLAGLESLPQDVFEAARIDGAGFWQELRHIILPLMLPTIAVTLLFRLIVAFKVFDEVFLLTGGGPGTSTEVVSFSIYRRFFTEDRMGYGSAMSVVTLFGLALLIIVAQGVARQLRRP
ncbi:MAG: sugar ABC transporter permease [Burkholderiales bacterium]|nr:sugar ABC transporter permease [Burkholderiales bacterium]